MDEDNHGKAAFPLSPPPHSPCAGMDGRHGWMDRMDGSESGHTEVITSRMLWRGIDDTCVVGSRDFQTFREIFTLKDCFAVSRESTDFFSGIMKSWYEKHGQKPSGFNTYIHRLPIFFIS